MKFNARIWARTVFLSILILTISAATPVMAAMQQAEAAPLPAGKLVIVEWVYRFNMATRTSGGAFLGSTKSPSLPIHVVNPDAAD